MASIGPVLSLPKSALTVTGGPHPAGPHLHLCSAGRHLQVRQCTQELVQGQLQPNGPHNSPSRSHPNHAGYICSHGRGRGREGSQQRDRTGLMLLGEINAKSVHPEPNPMLEAFHVYTWLQTWRKCGQRLVVKKR